MTDKELAELLKELPAIRSYYAGSTLKTVEEDITRLCDGLIRLREAAVEFLAVVDVDYNNLTPDQYRAEQEESANQHCEQQQRSERRDAAMTTDRTKTPRTFEITELMHKRAWETYLRIDKRHVPWRDIFEAIYTAMRAVDPCESELSQSAQLEQCQNVCKNVEAHPRGIEAGEQYDWYALGAAHCLEGIEALIPADLAADARRQEEDVAQTLAQVATKYQELLYAVGNKFPGESRHDTALRYIRQAEQPKDGQCQAAARKQAT